MKPPQAGLVRSEVASRPRLGDVGVEAPTMGLVLGRWAMIPSHECKGPGPADPAL